MAEPRTPTGAADHEAAWEWAMHKSSEEHWGVNHAPTPGPEGCGGCAWIARVEAEAQDTAASSGLREALDDLRRAVAQEFGVRTDNRDSGIPPGHGDLPRAFARANAALAQPTPEPDCGCGGPPHRGGCHFGWHNADCRQQDDTPEPSLRAEQEANSSAWHESIRRAQAAKEADTPEPSLRDALRQALDYHRGHDLRVDDETNAIRCDTDGSVLIGLDSLSAQPSEPGETT